MTYSGHVSYRVGSKKSEFWEHCTQQRAQFVRIKTNSTLSTVEQIVNALKRENIGEWYYT